MSGIYIPMEMPEEGWHKVIKIFSNGTVVSYYDSIELGKAIPVPDHGRLIDADALPYTRLYKDNWIKGTGREAPAVWKEDVDSAPTIIPASKEGEG